MPWTGVYAPPAPENYDPQDPYKDPVALTEQRQYAMRQHAIRVEKAKVGLYWISDQTSVG